MNCFIFVVGVGLFCYVYYYVDNIYDLNCVDVGVNCIDGYRLSCYGGYCVCIYNLVCKSVFNI